MKLRLLALAAASTAACATAALADPVTITTVQGDHITQPLITDFNSDEAGNITDLANGFQFIQINSAFTRDGGLGLWGGMSAPPPADNGVAGAFYETVLSGGDALLVAQNGLNSFQFYMGSPDEYNGVIIHFADLPQVRLDGNAIWGGNPVGNGDQTQGFTVTYNFASTVNSIEFTSTGNSFEFDQLAGIVSGGIPEPASWALMILGFGGAGAVLRGQRRRQAAAAAA